MITSIKKYVGDGLMIIFSVLFALFIDQQVEDYEIRSRKGEALEGIKKELLKNREIIEVWKEKHEAIRSRIGSVTEGKNTNLRNELTKYSYLNLGLLTNEENLISEFVNKTAWESAKSSAIISEFDFETVQKLTEVYSLQEVLMNNTFNKINDLSFDTESHDMENLDLTLIQFHLRFTELVSQEYLLEEFYNKALETLK